MLEHWYSFESEENDQYETGSGYLEDENLFSSAIDINIDKLKVHNH